MLFLRKYLTKPRRGRTAAGTIGSWADKLGFTENLVQACAGDEGKLTYLRDVPVFTGYLGTTAGWAGYIPVYLELHNVLLDPELKDELPRTFLHEVGHILDQVERGISDHSSTWRRVMARLGMPNETRCHSIPRSKMRASLKTITCNNVRCENTERTSKPETYSGRKCAWCVKGRLIYSPK